ncbi:VOC family protein [Solitalea canadensis]|uniref:Lactoylglutathione lyase-like lyase n=1 Tax=Solitalea canadensis (strain ATCC 29591 / DSM 3403 / JCM 21819 / LMG 8368 / NBRC 15130 / NCIMB 12057 / USAM 9D) TaxID=929556 RepID=H8KU74_SOLCM|nr:VOC family protein [Solitalea canadensis]AFD07186.1 lactoylglutathione lyase-like lyase [Solitalea canadensis DSM 3403]
MDKKKLLQGIDTVIVRVSDIEKAKEWYLHKLGLNSIYEDAQIGLVVVDTNGPTSLTLWKTEERIDSNKKSTSFPIFKTTDAKTLRQQLLDNAVNVTELNQDESIKYFQFYDPDGNVLEACETLEPM